MDTYKRIVIDSDESAKIINSINNIVFDLDNNFPSILEYLKVFENLHETYQLIEVFNYSYERIKKIYSSNDSVAINSYTMMLLSSGKMINESIEILSKDIFAETDNELEMINKKSSEEYDKNFSYRFLIRLRDFSQHGHVPVSFQDSSFCFDLDQIVKTSHFSHNKKMMTEMKDIIQEIKVKYVDSATLDYKYTVNSFVCSMYCIILHFLNRIQNRLINFRIQLFAFKKSNPKCFVHPKIPELDDVLCYTVTEDDNSLHLLSLKEDNPLEAFYAMLKDISRRYDSEMSDLKENEKRLHKMI